MKQQNHTRTQNLCGSIFSLRPRAKTEGKYFTSKMRITIIVLFYLTTQNSNTPNLSLTNHSTLTILFSSQNGIEEETKNWMQRKGNETLYL